MPDSLALLRERLGDRYRVQREIGHGGMALVYLATDLRHRRAVALKVLRPELADALGKERFLREIDLIAGLTHPNILPLHDSGELDGMLYFVMPYVDGESLRDRLRREGRLTTADALGVIRELADAIGYAHAHGVVHRDIKPENVLLQAGHALLSDFGIARSADTVTASRLTETGVAVGTLMYMSPEQATGSREVGAASDIYSLGCVLHEMVTGQTPMGPFSAPLATPPDATEWSPSAGVSALVRRMTAVDPSDRIASGKALLRAIDEARGDAPRGDRPREARQTRVRIAPRWTAAAAVVAVGLVAGGLYFARPRQAHAVAVLPLRDLSGDSTQAYFADGVHDALIAELAGIRALRVISRTSTLRYRTPGASVPEIATALGVDAVVEASVQRTGDSVSLRLHVVRATPAERDLGAESFASTTQGVLTLYRQVARAIALRLEAPLDADEAQRLETARPVDAAAYDAYLRGLYALRSGSSVEDFARGLALMNDAIARDSTEPLPWAGLALGYDQIGHVSSSIPDAFARARTAAERARALGGELPEALAALAITLLYDEWKPAEANALFEQAVARHRSIPDAWSHFGWSRLLDGDVDSAVALLTRAEAVDPLAPLWPAFTASAAYWVGRRDVAQAAIRRALAINSEFPIALYVYGGMLAEDGLLDSAIAVQRRAAEKLPAWQFGLGYALARAGRRDEALAVADRLKTSRSGMSAWGIAEIHAALGNADEALRWLEVARTARWNWIPWLDFNPAFQNLRADPRFVALRRQVGAPDCSLCRRR